MHRKLVFPSLLAVMAITRIGHFGSAVSLPDASLAVFLLGGLWLGGWGYFAAFMLAAFGIDFYLAQTATEAGWCLTPAYWGLVPTYGVMWLAGRWLGKGEAAAEPLRFAAVGLAATSLAFLISNLTFWAFSGHFGSMALTDYALQVAQYFPPYLGSAVLYLGLGWAVQRLILTRHVAAT
jgi:hypothetical protein